MELNQQNTTIQGATDQAQTRNPQQAPANLQPTSLDQTNTQSTKTGADLFSNTVPNAIVNIPGSAQITAESLVASDVETNVSRDLSLSPTLGIMLIALVVLASGFLIVRRVSNDL